MSMEGFELDHIGVLAAEFEPFLELASRLGATVRGPDQLPELGLEFVFIDLGGGVELEVIRPLAPDGPVAEQLEAGRGGVHHLAFRVADAGEALGALREAGFPTLDEAPRPGIHDTRIGFANVGSALVEVMQHPQPRP